MTKSIIYLLIVGFCGFLIFFHMFQYTNEWIFDNVWRTFKMNLQIESTCFKAYTFNARTNQLPVIIIDLIQQICKYHLLTQSFECAVTAIDHTFEIFF